MGINSVKHITGEIDGVRCTIIESGVSAQRVAFLSDLLSFNNLEVKKSMVEPAVEGDEPTYTIGVTEIIFNPVFAIYERSLKTPEGEIVTPGYWKQECFECDSRYWIRKRK